MTRIYRKAVKTDLESPQLYMAVLAFGGLHEQLTEVQTLLHLLKKGKLHPHHSIQETTGTYSPWSIIFKVSINSAME